VIQWQKIAEQLLNKNKTIRPGARVESLQAGAVSLCRLATLGMRQISLRDDINRVWG